MSGTGTYVYCLIAAPRRPSLRRIPKGPAGTGRVRLLAVAAETTPKQWLAAADAPLDQYGEKAINARLQDLDWVTRAAVAHEKVVEAFLAAPAVLPMKLFTIFVSDERALEHVARHRRAIDAAVTRVSNHEEWGVRVTLDRSRAEDPHGATTPRRGDSGSGYLARKRAQRDRTAELTRRAPEIVAGLYDQLAGLATAATRRSAAEFPASGGPLLLDAAFLVPRRHVRRFRAAAGRRAQSLSSDGYHVAITGPWPPYSFLKE